jgi:hypothetical protein
MFNTFINIEDEKQIVFPTLIAYVVLSNHMNFFLRDSGVIEIQ